MTTSPEPTTLADFEARRITGQDQRLADYLGSVVLVVNTASKCGLTPQFQGLESLYSDLREQGLVVLGFPCDQFANQEFADDAETAERWGVINRAVPHAQLEETALEWAATYPDAAAAWAQRHRATQRTGYFEWTDGEAQRDGADKLRDLLTHAIDQNLSAIFVLGRWLEQRILARQDITIT